MSGLETDHRVGYGKALAHHGELLQGVFFDEQECLHRGLVTLSGIPLRTEATFTVTNGGEIIVDPPSRIKAYEAAKLTLQYCNRSEYGGYLQLDSTIPCKIGLGSSTSDVCATIRAVAQAFSLSLLSEEIAQIAVRAEQACDSLMFETQQTVLFAHREGRVLEDFHAPLPRLEILGFNTDTTGQGVDTLALPPTRYTWREIELFRVLRAGLRKALSLQDIALLGRVATASACINQNYFPKPHFDQLLQLLKSTGILGLQVAHSGTVAGFLFDPAMPDLEEQVQRVLSHLCAMGFGTFQRFHTESKTFLNSEIGSEIRSEIA